MDFLSSVTEKIANYLSIPNIRVVDVIEILIIAVMIYYLLLWVKNTKAWMMMRGIIVLLVFFAIANFLHMNTILFLARNVASVIVIAAIIIFRPELRRAIEKLGERSIIHQFLAIGGGDSEQERFSDKVLSDIVRASLEMGRKKTGALMVIEKNIRLSEYERTGIPMDSLISSQLLINIFNHNTPLHDGAVLMRGDRIAAATCYLPLSDNPDLSKALGTRHRAGVGISEVSDALVIICSEETGGISIAKEGVLHNNVTEEELQVELKNLQQRTDERPRIRFWKGRSKDEAQTDR